MAVSLHPTGSTHNRDQGSLKWSKQGFGSQSAGNLERLVRVDRTSCPRHRRSRIHWIASLRAAIGPRRRRTGRCCGSCARSVFSWPGFCRDELPRLQYALPVIVGVGVALLFFYLQKDLGPALGVRLRFPDSLRDRAQSRDAGGRRDERAVGRLSDRLLSRHVPKTVHDRVAMWLSPWSNTVRGGDQVAHSLWAMASGGALGSGPGPGRIRCDSGGLYGFDRVGAGRRLGLPRAVVGVSDLRSADLAGAANRAARAAAIMRSFWRWG